MKAVVTGATGLVGSALVASLGGATVLSRSPEVAQRMGSSVTAHRWRPEDELPPGAAFAGADAVFHLAGDPVAEGRWTAEKKRRIRDSRVLGTRHLVEGLARLDARPRVLVCASAVGFYGDRDDELLDESSVRGAGFLADVCDAWEHEAEAAERLGVRVVRLRIGVVLAPGGGALDKLLLPFWMGAGGRIGDGRQWMPWIHLDDVVGLARFAAESASLAGAVNAVAPEPVTNADFARALGRALHRPAVVPVPAAALRLALGEQAAIVLASQRVVPRAAEHAGYVFHYPSLDGALASVVAAGGVKAAARSFAARYVPGVARGSSPHASTGHAERT